MTLLRDAQSGREYLQNILRKEGKKKPENLLFAIFLLLVGI
jgi:hypothetical protein